jgi:hypothetical protein
VLEKGEEVRSGFEAVAAVAGAVEAACSQRRVVQGVASHRSMISSSEEDQREAASSSIVLEQILGYRYLT